MVVVVVIIFLVENIEDFRFFSLFQRKNRNFEEKQEFRGETEIIKIHYAPLIP